MCTTVTVSSLLLWEKDVHNGEYLSSTFGRNRLKREEKPATERHCAQGFPLSYTPVSLLEVNKPVVDPHLFHCWWWKRLIYRGRPHLSDIPDIPARTDVLNWNIRN